MVRTKSLAVAGLLATLGCSSAGGVDPGASAAGQGAGGEGQGGSEGGSAGAEPGGSGGAGGSGGSGGGILVAGMGGQGGGFEGDPTSCDHAAQERTYVGCDFWPTVLPNIVGTRFDFTVVVANTTQIPAQVKIERGGQQIDAGEVPASGLRKFYLPWVLETKVFNGYCDIQNTASFDTSIGAKGAAYHLMSSVPVTVYQFNPLEYGPKGGPPGKEWIPCPFIPGEFSYSNDASLLLPSTALTNNYVVTAQSGMSAPDLKAPGYLSVTGLQGGTKVVVKIGPGGEIVPGGGLPGGGAGEVISFNIEQGDVAILRGTPETDLGGTLVQSDKPVQVMTGSPCIYLPFDRGACDHIEEVVFPVETLGKHYVVARPTGPQDVPVPYMLRLFGAADGTTLTYPAGAPAGAPSSLNLGEVHDFGVIEDEFEIVSDQPLAIATYMLGSSLVDKDIFKSRGDPAQSAVASVEQFSKGYVFLAPDDYDVSWADVTMPEGAQATIDGSPIGAGSPIGSGFRIARVKLDPGNGGTHLLSSDLPVGLQVMGYGFATSYQYPGGLNLKGIAPPLAPIDIK